jgi:hypothetical protein
MKRAGIDASEVPTCPATRSTRSIVYFSSLMPRTYLGARLLETLD